MQTNHHDIDIPQASNAGILAFVAKFVSYIFHPIFVPLYVILYLVYLHPDFFAGFSPQQQSQTILIVVLNLIFFPLLSIFLLKALGFIESIYLRKQRDRIIPYIVCGIFFFWAYTVFKEQSLYPSIVSSFILGIFLASSAALIANIYTKVSMHAIGMGGWLGLFLLIAFGVNAQMTWPLAVVILLTGWVCTSRLLLKVHNEKEIYLGLCIGLLAQMIAAFVRS